MKLMDIVIILLVMLLIFPAALAREEEVETYVIVNVTVYPDNTRDIVLYYPDGDYDRLSQVCSSANSTEKFKYTFPYEVECNITAMSWDIGNNITQIFNATSEIKSLIMEDLSDCAEIKKKNTEMSYLLMDYGNKTDLAAQTYSYMQKAEQCDGDKRELNTQLNEANEDVANLEKERFWFLIGGVVVGALGYWFLKVRKTYPSGPADEQFGGGRY